MKAILLTVIFGILFSIGVTAQAPPPSDPTSKGNQSPAGSPIGPGTGILLALAAA
ncbi:MAG: hypothetical protein WCP32_18675 [Bacteroidota bacterium]